MLPPQHEEEEEIDVSNLSMNPPTQYGRVTSPMNLSLQPIQENQSEDPHRPSVKTITTLPRFRTEDNVRYRANQRFKVKRKARPKLQDEDDDDEDDDDEYIDIWHRPSITNIDSNEDGKQLILSEYENMANGNFIQLLIENETECDKLSQLMCNKKLTSKDLTKSNRECEKFQLFDILKLNDEKDDGGLNPDDYDIDMREMEHLFHKFNNEVLHEFMSGYFDGKLPFEPRQPYPMGMIETDITKQRKVKSIKNPNYINQHRRKNKQRLKEKHRKKKEKARKKRRKEKKMQMKLAQKKRQKMKEKLSKQLAPETLNILFSPEVIDPNAKMGSDIDEEEDNLEIKAEELRVDDEALGNVHNEDTKTRIKAMRIQRQRSRRKDRMSVDRHSQALQSPVIHKLSQLGYIQISAKHTPEFDDDNQMQMTPISNVFDKQQLSMEAPPAMSKDYDGTVKRYARPIKMDQIEKVYKYVLFKAARQHFANIYLANQEITQCIEKEISILGQDYDQIKYQIETTNEDKHDICTDVAIKANDLEAKTEDTNDTLIRRDQINCDLDISYLINMKKTRDTDVLVQKYYVQKQQAMLQLMSMGVDLEDIQGDVKEDEMNSHQIKQAFIDGVDGLQINAEDKLTNHDEDDDNVRMSAIVYDSDDDKVNDRRWSSRGKWVEKALTDFCENEKKSNQINPKPWKKLHSKYVDEFVRKFCGFYPNESRPVAWKRIWHQNMNFKEARDVWPDDWMQQFDAGTLDMCCFGDELDDSKVKPIKCMDQITGELFANETLSFGPLFESKPKLKAFYNRVLNNIPALPLNLQDIELPSFVWRLNKAQLGKYGTYLLANWKQSANGKVTTNTHNEKYPLAQFRTDIEQRRWLGTKKWYVYRLRYWEAEDIEDFLDDVAKEGVEWFGSNDREKHTLIEDRICIQNDHCYGAPTLFIWSHDFCNDTGGSSKPIKIRNYGVSTDVASSDPIIQTEKSMFNLNAPIVPTGSMPSDGPVRSGTKLPIGARDIEFYYSDINGIVAMDAYVPPVFNLSVYDDMDSLYYNWNRVNHDDICDAASSKNTSFVNNDVVFSKMVQDKNNILSSWDDRDQHWVDYSNYAVFDRCCHSHPSILSNAFFFHNFLARTFYHGHKNIAKISYPRNWENAVFCKADSEEWTLSFGFTHPRPIAPEKYAVLLYKKDAFEVRVTTDTLKVQDGDDEEDKDSYHAKYEWSEERLEIILNIECDGKMKSCPLFSELIREAFDFKDCFHEIESFDFSHKKTKSRHKKFIFAENYFMSHVVIVSKSFDGEIKCYLDGRIVCKKNINELVADMHVNRAKLCTNILSNGDILIAHKPGNKKGKVHGLFHGYLYGISLHALCFQPFELNTLYRQLCVHRDLHVRSVWFRNKNELSKQMYKQFL